MSTTIATLANNVQSRIEENPVGGPGAWWSRQFELYTALIEACNDLMLLIGRPTQIVNFPLTLVPNQVWQVVPKGWLLVTDIQGAGAPLYKVNLWDMDYLQSSWGSDWTQDVDDAAKRWCPIGFNMFAVHPACSTPQTVNVAAIQYPTTDVWPYDGTGTVPFEDNYFEALEIYAAAYCRLKELGGEAQIGFQLLDQYMGIAKRMTQIQDRRDPLLFTMSYGAAGKTNPTTMR
jgi:hypothetical protein